VPYKMSIWVNIGVRNLPVFVGGNLRFRLVDTSGAAVIPSVGADVDPATGYIQHTVGASLAKVIQRGSLGNFLFTFWRYPDGFSGAVEAFDVTTPAENLGGTAINPQETENTNLRLSDVLPNLPGGAWAWTPIVRDSVSHALLAGAAVIVKDVPGNIRGQKVTDVTGQVPGNFALPNGNYLYTVNPLPGYNGLAAIPFTIAGADLTQFVDLVAYSTVAPVIPGVTAVNLTYLKGGVPVVGASFKAKLISRKPTVTAGSVQSLANYGPVITNLNGQGSLSLVQVEQFISGLGDGRYNLTIIDPDGTKSLDKNVVVRAAWGSSITLDALLAKPENA
jgi:hypothetical protein